MNRFVLAAAFGVTAIALVGCADNGDAADENVATTVDSTALENGDTADTAETASASGNFPQGGRVVVEDGVTFRIDPDGTRVRLGPGDSRIVVEDDIRYRVDPDGTRVRIGPDGAQIEVDGDVDASVDSSGPSLEVKTN